MKFKKITKTMTKEEFFEKEVCYCGCPDKFNFKNEYIEDCSCVTCEDCWLKAIEKNNIKFKNDDPDEQKVIDALKVVKDFCNDKELCIGCKFDLFGECQITKTLDHVPSFFEIAELEKIIKPQVIIYKVEHSKGGKQYTFIADEDLPIGTMVICDTKYGQSYGKIVDTFKGVDDGNKKCWRIK